MMTLKSKEGWIEVAHACPTRHHENPLEKLESKENDILRV